MSIKPTPQPSALEKAIARQWLNLQNHGDCDCDGCLIHRAANRTAEVEQENKNLKDLAEKMCEVLKRAQLYYIPDCGEVATPYDSIITLAKSAGIGKE